MAKDTGGENVKKKQKQALWYPRMLNSRDKDGHSKNESTVNEGA